jgi:hypothetical protein
MTSVDTDIPEKEVADLKVNDSDGDDDKEEEEVKKDSEKPRKMPITVIYCPSHKLILIFFR